MVEFMNSLTEKLTNMGNGAVVVLVIIIVSIVLGLAFLGVKHLNKEVDQDAS